MCRVDLATFEPDRTSAAQARSFVRANMRRWEIKAPQESALLLTSELVTNATVHAHTLIGVTVAVAEAILEVGVADTNPRLPRPRVARDQSQLVARSGWLDDGGRGLVIVDALADEWGIAEERNGKRVWFRLAVEEQWPHTTSCPCRGTDLRQAVSLASGRRVMHISGPWDD